MVNLEFNRLFTKRLLKASNHIENGLTKQRLDWLLENKNDSIGLIYHTIFSNTVYLICKNSKEEYRITVLNRSDIIPRNYIVENIEELLEYISFEQLYNNGNDEEKVNLKNTLEEYSEYPPGGILMIQNDKLFLYDFILGDNDEIA